ncbi:MAG: RidA family protein [Caldilineaceae bacterium]
MTKEVINPPQLFPSLQYGFSQIVTSSGGKTVYLSGQVAWDANQQIVGAGDLGIQAREALKNVATAVQIAGGHITDVVSMRIYIVEAVLAERSPCQAALRDFSAEQAPPPLGSACGRWPIRTFWWKLKRLR